MSRNEKKNVLFVCNHNSARSQISEYLLRQMYGERYEVYSAGKWPAEQIHPLAAEVLKEIDIDPKEATPKQFSAVENIKFDLIISVCEAKAEDCPVYVFGTTPLNLGIPDPAGLAAETDDLATRLNHFQNARNQLQQLIHNAINIYEAEEKRETKNALATKEKIENDFRQKVGHEVGAYLRQSLIINCPAGEEIYCIQRSNLEIILRDEARMLATSDLWAWWGLVLGLGSTILTAEFSEQFLSADQWELLFLVAFVVALIFSIFRTAQRFMQVGRLDFVKNVLKRASETSEIKAP